MPNPPDAVTVRVPGKINLHLSVGPQRADGFHDLVTVFHAVDLYDEVLATPADGLSVAVEHEPQYGPADGAGRGDSGALAVPVDARNTVWQAAALLARVHGVRPDVRLTIRKCIPVAGGMAGGSADAAAALLACARLWQLPDDPVHLSTLASRIGSDVAFGLVGGTAVGTGRGEVLVPVDPHAALHWVLVFADHGISAGAAYAELDRQRAEGTAPAPIGGVSGGLEAVLGALAGGSAAAVAAVLGNDLEPAAVALAPALARTLRLGREVGALAALVSGSGPTVALLHADAPGAAAAAAELTRRGVRAVTACGPVAGAEVVR